MHNESLAADYLKRSESRLKAIQVLFDEHNYADVVRESQEVVEICLKALLRFHRIEVPRIHDVSPVIDQNRDQFAPWLRERLDELIRISRQLRRDRELSFYGSEDLTPSEFYTKEDAETAFEQAKTTFEIVRRTQ